MWQLDITLGVLTFEILIVIKDNKIFMLWNDNIFLHYETKPGRNLFPDKGDAFMLRVHARMADSGRGTSITSSLAVF